MEKKRSGFHSEFSGLIDRCVTHLLIVARTKMYDLFTRHVGDVESVVDVGVTCDEVNTAANFFEHLFPDKSKITAVGIEDASHLERLYDGLKFVRVEPNKQLPFGDRTFTASFSNAVVEHIVEDHNREFFIKELHRISDRIFITTPNVYFPVEPHTGVPLLHFLWPKLFYSLLDRGLISKFYRSTNLRLISAKELGTLMAKLGIPGKVHKVSVYGIPSNLVFISEPRPEARITVDAKFNLSEPRKDAASFEARA